MENPTTEPTLEECAVWLGKVLDPRLLKHPEYDAILRALRSPSPPLSAQMVEALEWAAHELELPDPRPSRKRAELLRTIARGHK